jgi:hypothetical protein
VKQHPVVLVGHHMHVQGHGLTPSFQSRGSLQLW